MLLSHQETAAGAVRGTGGTAAGKRLTVSVVIPTYRRPRYLDMCVRSLIAQSSRPDEIIIVSRADDEPTNAKIAELRAELDAIVPVQWATVTQPGFLPPIEKGMAAAKHDIVAFIDDDAEAYPEWLERIKTLYASPRVGGVGGRYVNYFDFKLASYTPASVVGKLSWYGRTIGNMYRDTTFDDPVSVDFFIGGNMSYRKAVLDRVQIDLALNQNVGFHWEMDVAQQAKALGYDLIFDPQIRVKHHSAPREIEGMRTINYDGVYWSNFNYAYLMLKHLRGMRKLAYVVFTFVFGGSQSSGLLHLLKQLLSRKPVAWRDDIGASLAGRIAGIRYWMRQGR